MKKINLQIEKNVILNDMLSSITYTSNREADILAYMECYQKADTEHRPQLLKHLRACMDGNEYPNPYANIYGYTQDDVAQCSEILDDFLSALEAAAGNSKALDACIQTAVARINNLDEACDGALLDTWRRERLRAFLDTAMEQAQQIFQSANQTLQMP